MSKLLHISASPRSDEVRVPRPGPHLPGRARRGPARHPRRELGPVGRHAARPSDPTSPPRRCPSSPGERADRCAGCGVACRPRDLRPVRRRRPLPVLGADVERRGALHPQAAHRCDQPARACCSRSTGSAGYTGPARPGKRAAVIYTGAVYGDGRGRGVRLATSSSRTSTTGCAGPGSRTSTRSSSARTSRSPTPTLAGRRRTSRRPRWPVDSLARRRRRSA